MNAGATPLNITHYRDPDRVLVDGQHEGFFVAAWLRLWPDGRYHFGFPGDARGTALRYGLSVRRTIGLPVDATTAERTLLADAIESALNAHTDLSALLLTIKPTKQKETTMTIFKKKDKAKRGTERRTVAEQIADLKVKEAESAPAPPIQRRTLATDGDTGSVLEPQASASAEPATPAVATDRQALAAAKVVEILSDGRPPMSTPTLREALAAAGFTLNGAALVKLLRSLSQITESRVLDAHGQPTVRALWTLKQ